MNEEKRRHEVLRRLQEFPQPIRELADQNQIIHQTIEAYAWGSIITFEEALCRMIVLLAESNRKAEVQLFGLVAQSAAPPVFPVKP